MKKGAIVLIIAGLAFAVILTGCVSAKAKDEAPDPAAVMLWDFEDGTTQGWHGAGKFEKACSVNEDPAFVKAGKYSLKIDAKGSQGWNQDLAVTEGPFNENLGTFKTITVNMFVPGSTVAGLEYAQVFLVFSGEANGWYQSYLAPKSGWNALKYKVDPAQISGEMWHMFIVFNTGGSLHGPVYVDSITGSTK